MTNTVKLSINGMFGAPMSLFPIGAMNRQPKADWVYRHKVSIGTLSTGDKRHVTKVKALSDVTKKQEEFWMDCITGTLYNKEGRCLSSEVLHLLNVADSPDAAEELLKKRMPSFIGEAYR